MRILSGTGFKKYIGTLLLCLSAVFSFNTHATTDLVFIVDGSGSINSTDWNIQRNGIVAAIQDPLVIPRDGSIAISVVQFSGSTRIEFPYTLIDSEADAQAAISAVQGMSQFRSSTGPGNGINAATSHLTGVGALKDDFQSYCMSTDGTRNTGATVGDAISSAKTAAFELDRYSVIAIEDPPFFDAGDAATHYGPHVFGGGAVFVVNNFTEFASFIGALCLGEPLKLVGMEVTQVIQDLENKVKLVEKKKTLVRTYLEPKNGTDPVKATARLKGTRGGVDLPGSPLTASNSGGAIIAKPNAISRRNLLTDSLNFQLPESWLTGTIELELEGVGGTLDCMEKAGPSANDCKATVTFNTGSELEVKFVKVSYTSGGSTIASSNADMNELEKRLLATFPTSKIDRTTGTLNAGAGVPVDQNILSSLSNMRFLDFCWNVFGCDRLYYGAIDQTGSLVDVNGNGNGGLANGIPGSVSTGVIRDGNSYGRNRHGHEIAHTMGRHHATNLALVGGNATSKNGPCGSVSSLSGPEFPNIATVSGSQRATLGPMGSGDDKLVFGWDSQRNSVVDPNQTFEMMSYCPGYRWPSDFTYEGIRSFINSTFSPASVNDKNAFAKRAQVKHAALMSAKASTAALVDWMLIRGIIDIDLDTVVFDAINHFQIDSSITPPSLPGSDYHLIIKDVTGAELNRIPFTPMLLESDSENGGGSSANTKALFLIPVMADPAIWTFEIEKQPSGPVIGSLTSSDNPPVVEVTFPNGGEILNPPSTTFMWTGSDADGDSLLYTVQFSPDAGATWETIATDYVGTSLEVDLGDLGKTSDGLLRVQASEGFNVAQDDSDGTFVTPNTPPTCDITTPFDNASFIGVQPIALEAFAHDAEDESITNVQWTSNLDGNIGNGLSLITELGTGTVNGIKRLREGSHTITMTCTDAGGLSSTDTVDITLSLTQPQIKGDADNDGDLDKNDINLIRQDLGKPVDGSACGAKCDMNDDLVINALDMRLVALSCTRPSCAVE
ncbi:DUF1194 domain-containing protein [Flocculibacter collagenilyticus]|uniref:DUF1194 domain-containing protein n=1 Tax=Flocculibacter collagenilyticus TaxID=2744479 RepID=UPI0018F3906B|nr:DUF1194 domain-containing protein [Flocculibacter collagenilyticus]